MTPNNKFIAFLYYDLPIIAWASFIFYVSSYPTATVSTVQTTEFMIKKLAHVMVYGILAILIYRKSFKQTGNRVKSILIAVAGSALYGLFDEVHQGFVPRREPRLRDVFIDTIGATIAVFLWSTLPKLPKKLKA